MATSPICLIQWLKPGEYRETAVALSKFAREVRIDHDDVFTKQQAGDALKDWFKEGAGNAQFCLIGSHGVLGVGGRALGIGATGKTGEFVTWRELWDWFSPGELMGALWLGACRSSHPAAALSPFLGRATRPVIPYIYGFNEDVYPAQEIEKILLQLIEFTQTEQVVPLDEELEVLRDGVPGAAIELYYPASTLTRTVEYANVDKKPETIGMTFPQLLENQRSVGA